MTKPSEAIIEATPFQKQAIDNYTIAVPHAQEHVIPYLGELPIEQRMNALKALANTHGLRLPDTRLPEGTALLPVGEEAKRQLQTDLKNLPPLEAALDAYEARLRSEKPEDSPVKANMLRMSPLTAGLFNSEKSNSHAGIGYTRDGFFHTASFIKPNTIRNGFGENLLALPAKLRAEVFNHWAERAVREDDKPVIMRSFIGGEKQRLVRAVTSETHSLTSGDDISIVSVLRGLPRGAVVRITRSPGGSWSELEVIWSMAERQLVVGDVALGMLRITNSETKQGGLRVECALLRVLCYNFTTAFSEDLAAESTTRHVGDLSRRLPLLIQNAQKRLEPFVKAFGDAYRSPLPESLSTRAALLERAERVFDLPEGVLKRANELWDADGLKGAGDTRAGFVNALTRASQTQGISDAARTERAAGRIVLEGWGPMVNGRAMDLN